ncbi:MAG: CPBP family intramembrane glutamic endopeptidase [Candidatus Falkowbacteria bacterium]
MERIYEFMPSVFILAGIAGVTLLYLKLIIKRFGKNFKSVEWHERNKRKVAWSVGTPSVSLWAPAVEELIFRAPLIIAFSAISSVAWYGIFASSALFALMHWFGNKICILDIFSVRENGEHKSDNVADEVDRLRAEEGKMVMARKVFHVVLTFPLGILAGYYGIKYQSVWVAFGIHSAWNLIMPAVLQIIMLIVMLATLGVTSLWHKVRWNRKRLC